MGRTFIALGFAAAAFAVPRLAPAQECTQDSEVERARCLSFLAMQSGDSSYCDGIDSGIDRTACQAATARTSGNAQCATIEDSYAREHCYYAGRVGQVDAAARAAEAAQAEEDREVQRDQLETSEEQTDLIRQQLEEQRTLQLQLADSLETLELRNTLLEEEIAILRQRLAAYEREGKGEVTETPEATPGNGTNESSNPEAEPADDGATEVIPDGESL